MTIRYLLLVCLFSFFSSTGVFAQNLFSEKVDERPGMRYCLDCGSPQATVAPFTLAQISERINYRYNLKGGSGSISFQVLVDSVGLSSVISHSDVTKSPLTDELVILLNTCIWRPARVNGKRVNASVNVTFEIRDGKISGRLQRMDLSGLEGPGNATVYNKQYQYTNPSLKSYNLTVWTKFNSPLPQNSGIATVIDSTNVMWYGTARGLTLFDGKGFSQLNEVNSPFTPTTFIEAIAVDKENAKWIYANKAVYTFNQASNWRVYDSAHLNIPKPYRIVTTSTGEVFFPTFKGLMIFKGDKVRLIDKGVVWQLPSNDVKYAYFDSKKRLWIGTARGTIMIGKEEKVTAFNNSNTPLNNACITNITEDAQGNMYFTLGSLKTVDEDVDEEGLAVLNTKGQWTFYNDKNSGLPANHINTILYDKFENVLWLGTQKAGLVRFDLKDGWENYHNNNTTMPGFNILHLMQDGKGTVYAATANGLVRISKK